MSEGTMGNVVHQDLEYNQTFLGEVSCFMDKNNSGESFNACKTTLEQIEVPKRTAVSLIFLQRKKLPPGSKRRGVAEKEVNKHPHNTKSSPMEAIAREVQNIEAYSRL
ncbi:hypothetical protein ACTXT7_004056 [Hymenolepis weldensis]